MFVFCGPPICGFNQRYNVYIWYIGDISITACLLVCAMCVCCVSGVCARVRASNVHFQSTNRTNMHLYCVQFSGLQAAPSTRHNVHNRAHIWNYMLYSRAYNAYCFIYLYEYIIKYVPTHRIECIAIFFMQFSAFFFRPICCLIKQCPFRSTTIHFIFMRIPLACMH